MSYDNEFEKILDELLATKAYGPTLDLLRGADIKSRITDRCSDAIQACFKYLTEDNYDGNLDLYCCSEEFLKYVAGIASPEEILLELLEVIETCRSDNVFTSALKSLQICLQRQQQNRVNGLEWSLNSIHTFVTELKRPAILEANYDDKQEKLFEQDADVHRILMSYMTIALFLEPLVDAALLEDEVKKPMFKDVTRTRRNILACFVVQLLGKPLALLDLSKREDSTNSYSHQCAEKLLAILCRLIGDPYWLLTYGELKVRWKRRNPRNAKGVYENAPQDMFVLEEKTPLTSLGVFYYLLFTENLLPLNSPKIYHPLYVFEMCLYLIHDLLSCQQAALQLKGIRLGAKLLSNLVGNYINCRCLDLQVHPAFCAAISDIIVFSTVDRNRKEGLHLLRNYILHFDRRGKFQLVQNLIRTTKHNGLIGYLIGMYKNLLASSIDSEDNLPEHFKTTEFKEFLLKTICNLPKNVETDLIEYSEQILAALNVVRYLSIRDQVNRLGFWDFVSQLKAEFLKPLRTAIDLSKAHFKVEKQQVSSSNEEFMPLATELQVSLPAGEQLPQITKQHKLNMLESALLTFDLMESLLARVEECVEVDRLNKS